MKKSAWLIGLLSLAQLGWAQSQKEVITKTGRFTNTAAVRVVSVENMQGNVRVIASKTDQVELTAEKIITAETPSMLEKGMREVNLKMVESGDTVYVFLEAPFIQRKKRESPNVTNTPNLPPHSEDTNLAVPVQMEMNASNNPAVIVSINRNNEEYDYNFDLTLQVPEKVNVIASTVTKGDVEVRKISGEVKARNVTGPITLTEVAGPVQAHTVSGPIHVSFAQNPTGNSTFKTLNGAIQVNYQPNLNAVLAFKSILGGPGQFHTDLTNLKPVPGPLTKTRNQNAGTVYPIGTTQNYQAGKGGITLLFETMNGTIALQKK
jgi:hypothetical protein